MQISSTVVAVTAAAYSTVDVSLSTFTGPAPYMPLLHAPTSYRLAFVMDKGPHELTYSTMSHILSPFTVAASREPSTYAVMDKGTDEISYRTCSRKIYSVTCAG